MVEAAALLVAQCALNVGPFRRGREEIRHVPTLYDFSGEQGTSGNAYPLQIVMCFTNTHPRNTPAHVLLQRVPGARLA